jgi:hypothetical protein
MCLLLPLDSLIAYYVAGAFIWNLRRWYGGVLVFCSVLLGCEIAWHSISTVHVLMFSIVKKAMLALHHGQ